MLKLTAGLGMFAALLVTGSGCAYELEDEETIAEESSALDYDNGWDNGAWANGAWANGAWDNGAWANGAWANGDLEELWANPRQSGTVQGYAYAWTRTWGSRHDSDWDFVPTTNSTVWVESNSCAHPTSVTGSALASSCNPLVTSVCALTSSCCATSWTSSCVNAAKALSTTASSSPHNVITEGASLSTGHSNCAAVVCAADSYCCSTAWDDQCVEEAAQLCTARYLTRARVESSRVVVDVCEETKVRGVPACPLLGRGPLGVECCRRALVLKGVYKVGDDTSGYGRQIQWLRSESVTTPFGTRTIKATLVPDPKVYKANRFSVTGDEHHLWQAAGPAKPLYPDCRASGLSGATKCNSYSVSTCTDSPADGTEFDKGFCYRDMLVGLLSILTTTDGHYRVDVTMDQIDSSIMQPDPAFATAGLEARWEFSKSDYNLDGVTDEIMGHPDCYYAGSPQRAGGLALIRNVDTCASASSSWHLMSKWQP